MKKFLSIVVLAGAAVTSLAAVPMTMSTGRSAERMAPEEMVKDMMSFKNKLRGKTLELSGSLMKEDMALHAKMLNMASEALKQCGKLNFKAGSPEMKKYDVASQKAAALATALQGLPVKTTMKKNFDKIDDWMQFMVDKKQLKARFLKEVAKKLNDPEMEKKADKFASMAAKFKTMMAEESTESEATEEAEVAGCPLSDQSEQQNTNPGEEVVVVMEEDQE